MVGTPRCPRTRRPLLRGLPPHPPSRRHGCAARCRPRARPAAPNGERSWGRRSRHAHTVVSSSHSSRKQAGSSAASTLAQSRRLPTARRHLLARPGRPLSFPRRKLPALHGFGLLAPFPKTKSVNPIITKTARSVRLVKCQPCWLRPPVSPSVPSLSAPKVHGSWPGHGWIGPGPASSSCYRELSCLASFGHSSIQQQQAEQRTQRVRLLYVTYRTCLAQLATTVATSR